MTPIPSGENVGSRRLQRQRPPGRMFPDRLTSGERVSCSYSYSYSYSYSKTVRVRVGGRVRVTSAWAAFLERLNADLQRLARFHQGERVGDPIERQDVGDDPLPR